MLLDVAMMEWDDNDIGRKGGGAASNMVAGLETRPLRNWDPLIPPWFAELSAVKAGSVFFVQINTSVVNVVHIDV